MFLDLYLLYLLPRTIFRPAGFIGIGFFLAFAGLAYLIELQQRAPLAPAPSLPQLSELGSINGTITRVDPGKNDTLALEVTPPNASAVALEVPDVLLKEVDYIKLKGKPIAVRVDAKNTVYVVEFAGKTIVTYEDAAQRESKVIEAYEEELAFKRRLPLYSAAVMLFGVLQFGLGIVWWRRRGYP